MNEEQGLLFQIHRLDKLSARLISQKQEKERQDNYPYQDQAEERGQHHRPYGFERVVRCNYEQPDADTFDNSDTMHTFLEAPKLPDLIKKNQVTTEALPLSCS